MDDYMNKSENHYLFFFLVLDQFLIFERTKYSYLGLNFKIFKFEGMTLLSIVSSVTH